MIINHNGQLCCVDDFMPDGKPLLSTCIGEYRTNPEDDVWVGYTTKRYGQKHVLCTGPLSKIRLFAQNNNFAGILLT